MTRKDYKLIVSHLAVILQSTGNKNSIMVKGAVEDFCQDLKQDNPRFDKEKFLAVLGY